VSCWSRFSFPRWSGWSAARVSPSTPIRIAVACAALAIACASGCARTVLVAESSPVRVGPCVRGRVYALVGGEWRLGGNAVELPEGWYLVPPSYVEDE